MTETEQIAVLRYALEAMVRVASTGKGCGLKIAEHALNVTAKPAEPVPSTDDEYLTQDEELEALAAHFDRLMAIDGLNAGLLVRKLKSTVNLKPAEPKSELTVLYRSMPESNGKSNWTATLVRKSDTGFDSWSNGYTFCRSEYPDRVRYEADSMRFLIGEIITKPRILDYDSEKRSDYVAAKPAEHVSKPDNLRDWIMQSIRNAIDNNIPGCLDRCHSDDIAYLADAVIAALAAKPAEPSGKVDVLSIYPAKQYFGVDDLMQSEHVVMPAKPAEPSADTFCFYCDSPVTVEAGGYRCLTCKPIAPKP